ncbi:hypothetical protein B0T24DRAFT_604033, partial [Lasiosphaeria ovina]
MRLCCSIMLKISGGIKPGFIAFMGFMGFMPFIGTIGPIAVGPVGMPPILARPAAILVARALALAVRGCLPTPILGPVGALLPILSLPDWPRTRWRTDSWVRSMARLIWPTSRFSRPGPRELPFRIALGPVGAFSSLASSLAGASVIESMPASKPPSMSSSCACSPPLWPLAGAVLAGFAKLSASICSKSHFEKAGAVSSSGPRPSKSPAISAAISFCVFPFASMRTKYSDMAPASALPLIQPRSVIFAWIIVFKASASGVPRAISTDMSRGESGKRGSV